MKPDWKDAPKEANYLAQDSDGQWFWYDEKPEYYYGAWSLSSDEGMFWRAGESESPKGPLEQRPTDKRNTE
jgi:hypothetical protein